MGGLQAQEVNAKAYTQGNDLHFAPGEYNPATKEGQELIGHELTHVIQQKQGRVGEGDLYGKGLMINQDAALEQEADEAGKKVASGNNVDLVSHATSGTGDENPIQRFEAPGHEAVERVALTSDGKMSNDEASLVYYGNWMRDMNQALVPSLADNLSPDIVFVIINFLGYKKFGRYMNAEEFGYYIPSEHMDNPAGQLPGKGFDYYSTPPGIHPDMYKEEDRFKTSAWPARPESYTTNQENNDPVTGTVEGANLFSVDQKGVMAYIRRTNAHVEDRLQYAAEKGRTPEGMMHLGAALHAVEDLFAHSNYVEIAVDQLLKEDKNLLTDLEPENRYVRKLTSEVDNMLTPEAGDRMPVLTTGTFTSGDTLQSVGAEGVKMLKEGLGPVKTDVEKAAQSELMDKLVLSVDRNPTLKKKVVDALFVPLIPDFLKSTTVPYLYEAPLYSAYSILQMIPNIALPVDFQDIKALIKSFLNNNILKPAGEEIEARLLVSKVQDTPLYKVETENNKVIQSGGKSSGTLDEISTAITGKKPDYRTELEKANKRKQLYDNTPAKIMVGASHSQLAKDHANSIFFGLAFKLSVEADKMLRNEMLNYWSENKFHDSDSTTLAQDPKDLDEKGKNKQEFIKQRNTKEGISLAYGKYVYTNGHEKGQEYNLQDMRDEAAEGLLTIATVLTQIKDNVGKSLEFLNTVGKMVGKTGKLNTETKNLIRAGIGVMEKGALKIVEENNRIELDKVVLEFTETSKMVKDAHSLEEREDAYTRLLYARDSYIQWVVKVFKTKDPKYSAYGLPFYLSFATVIDKEMAIVAPAYPKEQVHLLAASSDPLHRSTINLPSAQGKKYESLIMASRRIIDHPYASNWWKPYVHNFMTIHAEQIKEEIRARNAGYAHFGGEHNH